MGFMHFGRFVHCLFRPGLSSLAHRGVDVGNMLTTGSEMRHGVCLLN